MVLLSHHLPHRFSLFSFTNFPLFFILLFNSLFFFERNTRLFIISFRNVHRERSSSRLNSSNRYFSSNLFPRRPIIVAKELATSSFDRVPFEWSPMELAGSRLSDSGEAVARMHSHGRYPPYFPLFPSRTPYSDMSG